MSQHRQKRKKVPMGVWVLALIFAALFIIPLASSGGATDNTMLTVIGCLIGLVGFIFLIAKFVIPQIGKAAQRGVKYANDFDQQMVVQQQKAIVAKRNIVRAAAPSTNTIITTISTSQPVAEIPLPDRWEQIRRQMFFLGYDDAKAIPKTAVLSPMIIIEDPTSDLQRSVASRLLIEQLLTKADEIALCIITTSHVFDNLTNHFDNIYLVGGPEGKRKLPQELHAYYGNIADEESADAFCQTLIDHGDHAVINLGTYTQEQQTLKILSNLLYGLFARVSTSTRQCILILDNAHKLLPNEDQLGKGLFTNSGNAKNLREDLLIMLNSGQESGLYTYLITAEPSYMDIRAVFACKFWIANKVLVDRDAKLVQGRMLAKPHEIARLNREALFTEDISTSPIKSIMLRPSDTEHREPPWARAQQQEPSQLSSVELLKVQTGGVPAIVDPQKDAKVESLQPTAEEEEEILPEMLEYVWYVRRYAADFYSAKMLAYPPEDLYPILEALDLADTYEENEHVFSERTANALMHRTDDQSKDGNQIALEVRARVLAFQDSRVDPPPLQEITEEEEEYEDEELEAKQPQVVPHPSKTSSTSIPTPSSVFQMVLDWTSPWKMPSTTLLEVAKKKDTHLLGTDPEELISTIRQVLLEFKVYADVLTEDIKIGPSVIRFGIRPTGKPMMTKNIGGNMVPARDDRGNIIYETRTRTSRIMALQNDLALVLEAKSIRMEAPVPGHRYVGVEIPNPNARIVTLREILEWPEYKVAAGKSKLVFGLGQDVAGQVQVPDLAKMPHLLIAGATGSGKSVLINVIIASILYNATPEEVQFLMVDPKMVELKMYDGIPHLMRPVVTEVDKVVPLLKQAVGEMERRYRIFSGVKVRNLDGYRKLRNTYIARGDASLPNLPAIVIVIDELADLMMAAPQEVEGLICRLAQLARATGIHLVVATQRPSVDVITGLIKANLPTRISFMVSSAVDSRTIIDMGGAERLLGKGDALYLPAEAGRPDRIQASFIDDKEAESLANFWRLQTHVQQPGNLEVSIEDEEADDLEDLEILSNEADQIEETKVIIPQIAPEVAAPAKPSTSDPFASIPSHMRPFIERIAQGERIRMGKEHSQARKHSKEDARDELRFLVAAYVFRHGMISTTALQRHFHVGYGIASEITEDLEDLGILEPYKGRAQARCLTQHRGGNDLPEVLRAIRNLIDQHHHKGNTSEEQSDDEEAPQTDDLEPVEDIENGEVDPHSQVTTE